MKVCPYLKKFFFCRHRKSVAQKCQFNVDTDMSIATSFTSSDVHHLDTVPLSKSPSISRFESNIVDSAEVEILHNRDEKNPIVKKPYIHETSAMISDTMRRKREHLLICSNIDRCLILNNMKKEQMIPCFPQSIDLHNNDSVSKDNAKMQEERLHKRYCEESLEFPSEQPQIKKLVECSKHGLITDFCPARNSVHSQRSDNPLQTDRKGELHLAAVLQRQQQSSSRQADRGWWNTRRETDIQLFKLNKHEKPKKRKHFFCRHRKSVDQKCQSSDDKDQSEENPFTSSINTYSRSQSTLPIVGSRVDSAEVEILYNRDDAKKSRYS